MSLDREKLRMRDFARLRSDVTIEVKKIAAKTSDVDTDLQKAKDRLAKLFETIE